MLPSSALKSRNAPAARLSYIYLEYATTPTNHARASFMHAFGASMCRQRNDNSIEHCQHKHTLIHTNITRPSSQHYHVTLYPQSICLPLTHTQFAFVAAGGRSGFGGSAVCSCEYASSVLWNVLNVPSQQHRQRQTTTTQTGIATRAYPS